MNAPNFQVVMLAKGKARVEIYDVLGPSWLGMIDTKLVANQLKDAGEIKEIELRINSPGGSAWEGLGIHNVLKDHPAKVSVVIDGVAASAASLVAMSGDTIRIPTNAMMMIHEPMTFAFGTKDDLKKGIDALDAVTSGSVATYAAKSGQPENKIAKWMKDETWFVGQDAVDAGLADTTEKELPAEKMQVASSVRQQLSTAPREFSSFFGISMQLKKEPPIMADKTTTTAPATPPAAPVTTPAPEATAQPETPAAPQITTADVTAAVTKALDDERNRTTAIMAVCRKAGKPELADDFIAQKLTLQEVNAKMIDVLCKDRPPVGDGGGNDAPPAKDPDAGFKAEYAKDRPMFQKAGLTEEDYVASRRVDEKLDPLVQPKPFAAAKK